MKNSKETNDRLRKLYQLSREEIDKRFSLFKLKMTGEYINAHTPTDTLCNCGRTFKVAPNEVYKKNIKSCGHLNNKRFERAGLLSERHFARIKSNARSKNREFNLSAEYLWELFLKQDKRCAISGVNLNLTGISKRINEDTASVDRIDSNKGYIPENVQWVHKKINRMKMDMSDIDFIRTCSLIASYNAYDGKFLETTDEEDWSFKKVL